MSKYQSFIKNVPNWEPSAEDYRLVFREVDGLWREVTGNMPQYSNIILADYLSLMDMQMPDGVTFCRIKRINEQWEYREYGGMIRIDYDKHVVL